MDTHWNGFSSKVMIASLLEIFKISLDVGVSNLIRSKISLLIAVGRELEELQGSLPTQTVL